MKVSVSFLALVFLCASCTSPSQTPEDKQPLSTKQVENSTDTVPDVPNEVKSMKTAALPIDRALERVTKKPFWLKVSPKSSPVSPERFAGYHTGADFETFPEEQNEDVVIRSICTGPLVLKKWATGYGGVAVQECFLQDQDVTVIYGHLKLASVTATIRWPVLQEWEKIGILGKGFSTETDGERKHLHLSIHKGSIVDIKGYAATSAELGQWMDPMGYFQTQGYNSK